MRFSGAERCITCWDQTFLGDYDAPNHFLIQNLQTDKGKARIDGVESDRCETNPGACDLFHACVHECAGGKNPFDYEECLDVCDKLISTFIQDGEDFTCTRDAALLGVSAKHLAFSGGSTGRAVAGMAITGLGRESAKIRHDVKKDPPDELREAGVRAAGSLLGSKDSGRKTRTQRQPDLDEEIPAE